MSVAQTSRALHLGVDPGLKGALALIEGESRVVEVFDMPVIPGSKGRNVVDVYALARWIDLKHPSIAAATVEDVRSQPNDGVASAFKFGRNKGVVEAIIASAFIPIFYVAPATWKMRMGVTSDKSSSRRRASQLYPDASDLFARVKDDGRAEAVLLAWFGLTTKARGA